MLREILVGMDEEFIADQVVSINEDPDGYQAVAIDLIVVRAPSLRDFFATSVAGACGEDAVLGAVFTVTLPKNRQAAIGETEQWLENSLSLLDDEFCATQAVELMTDSVGYAEATRQLINEHALFFKAFLRTMSREFDSASFGLGALVLLEFFRRFEEGNDPPAGELQ